MVVAADALEAFGGELLVVHIGDWSDRAEESSALIGQIRKSIDAIACECEKRALRLAIENITPYTTEQLADVMGQFDPNLVGACLDTGHANLNDDVVAAVRRLGKRIFSMHIADNPGDEDAHTIPGQGTIDWPGFAKATAEVGFAGPFVLELRNYGDALETIVEGREALQNILAQR